MGSGELVCVFLYVIDAVGGGFDIVVVLGCCAHVVIRWSGRYCVDDDD